jgi:predicted nucleotidyltransferase
MLFSTNYNKHLNLLSESLSDNINNLNELDIEDISIPANMMKDSLNHKIWENNKLKSKIRTGLLKITKKYIEHLDLVVKPKYVYLLGSMANYNWTEASDIDVHIFYDLKEINEDTQFASAYLESKGKEWKEKHHITIKMYDVELYAQGIDSMVYSKGVYDLINDNWISVPKKEDVSIDKNLLKTKILSLGTQIENIESHGSYKRGKRLKDKINAMRQSALEQGGEFSIENLVFKYLRNNGYMKRLVDVINTGFDKELSIDEDANQLNEANNMKTTIFKGKRNPNLVITVTMTPDGRITEINNKAQGIRFPFSVGQILNRNHEVWACNNHFFVNSKDTCPEEKIFGIKKSDIPQGHELRMLYPGKFKNESKNMENINENKNTASTKHRLIVKKSVDNIDKDKAGLIKEFILECFKELKIDKPGTVVLTALRDGVRIVTTASYSPEDDQIWIYVKGRAIVDICRSIAHEIRHFRQMNDGEIKENSGDTGSSEENAANAFAGIMIRKFGKKNPKLYEN